MAALAPGIVVDRYQVESLIGAGAMGQVVRAIDLDLKRAVAIKILSEKHRDNNELRARFIREGRAVAAISHPNVVQVFTTGTYDERPYIAMEALVGVDLGSIVADRGPMDSFQAARATLDAARGLQAASAAGLIHRDVKPSNLMLLDTGSVKVTDFGLAKPLIPSNEPALTALGVVVGTPDYIAPEQAKGESIDERVDIYSLGGTLFFLLTGKPPFRTGNAAEDKYLKVVARHLNDPPPNAVEVNPHADAELADLAQAMMAKQAHRRPDYKSLIAQLEQVIQRLRARAPSQGEAQAAMQGPRSGVARESTPTPYLGGKQRLASTEGASLGASTGSSAAILAANRPSRWLVASTVISVLIFIAGLGLFLLGPKPTAPVVPATDSGVALVNRADAGTVAARPKAPDGYLLIDDAQGRPQFFISARAVKASEFAALFPNSAPKPLSNKDQQQAVARVRYRNAQAYAAAQRGRLPTPEEWKLARSHPDFAIAGRHWEWTDDGSPGTQAQQSVTNGTSVEKRSPMAHADVTFRLVKDL